MSTDVFDDDDYINTAGMGSRLPVQATELLRGIGSQILRSLLVAAPGDIPEEFGCSPEEAAVALACCELAELPAWDEAALIDAATVGGIEEARVMWGHQSRNQLACRISLAMKAEKAPEVMSPADGVLLLRRAGINVFHQLLDAVAVIALDGPEPERNYRLLKGIAEPHQTAPATETATPAPVEDETTKQRRARWLDWFGNGERGALKRVHERELQLNPKADRSFIGKEIKVAKTEKADMKRAGGWSSQLVQDGKRKG